MPGAKHKKNKKNVQRRAATARTTAPAQLRFDAEQAPTLPPDLVQATPSELVAATSSPPDLAKAKTPPPELTRAKTPPPGLTRAKTPTGLTPARPSPPGVVLETSEYSKLVRGTAGPSGLVWAGSATDKATATAKPPTTEAEQPSPAGEQDDLPAWAAKAIEEVLTVTYWLDPGEHGDPFDVTIGFSGRRADVTGKPGPGDTTVSAFRLSRPNESTVQCNRDAKRPRERRVSPAGRAAGGSGRVPSG
jgi:hypothetical protein